MKVFELIEQLKDCHPNSKVTVSMAVDSLPEDSRNEYFRIFGDVDHINETSRGSQFECNKLGAYDPITLIAIGEPNYPFKLLPTAPKQEN